MIKIIIINDHPIVLEGLKTLLASHNDMEVIASYDTGRA